MNGLCEDVEVDARLRDLAQYRLDELRARTPEQITDEVVNTGMIACLVTLRDSRTTRGLLNSARALESLARTAGTHKGEAKQVKAGMPTIVLPAIATREVSE